MPGKPKYEVDWPHVIKVLLAAHGSWLHASRARRFVKKLGIFCCCDKDHELFTLTRDFITVCDRTRLPYQIIADFKATLAEKLDWNQNDFDEIEKLKIWWAKNPNAKISYIFFGQSYDLTKRWRTR